MEENLEDVWIISISDYRDLFVNWIENYSENINETIYNEDAMWEAFQIYTEDNILHFDHNGNFIFKIKDKKKFTLARLKYDF